MARCQYRDRVSGTPCVLEAEGRAPRKDAVGTVEDISLCKHHYQALRLERLVGPMRPRQP